MSNSNEDHKLKVVRADDVVPPTPAEEIAALKAEVTRLTALNKMLLEVLENYGITTT